jgi:hypothetical protein
MPLPAHMLTLLKSPKHALAPSRHDVDQLLLHYYHEAAAALQAAGLRGEQRLRFLVDQGAGHHELAWQWRLTGALQFLLAPWWEE